MIPSPAIRVALPLKVYQIFLIKSCVRRGYKKASNVTFFKEPFSYNIIYYCNATNLIVFYSTIKFFCMRKYLPKAIPVPCYQLLSFKKNIGLYSNKFVLNCIYKSVRQLKQLLTITALNCMKS